MAKDWKKDAAKDLWLTGRYTQQDIARIVNVGEQTIKKWRSDGNWQAEKSELEELTTKNEMFVRELMQFNLMTLLNKVREQKKAIENKELNWADAIMISSSETDAVSKLYATIRKKDLSYSDKCNVVTDFMEFLESKDANLAQGITLYYEQFIQTLAQKMK